MSKCSFSKEEKLAIIKFYHEERNKLNEVAKIFDVHLDTIKDWQNNYHYFGKEGLEGEHFTFVGKVLKLNKNMSHVLFY